MTFFSLATLPVSRWKNGGGETREICRIPADGPEFGWRASIATVAQDGAFSSFPGVDRVITLLAGDDVILEGDGWQQRLRRHEPFTFAGEQTIFARLQGSSGQDFNLMTRRNRYCASMSLYTTTLAPPTAGVAYVLRGGWQCGAQRLAATEGIWWTTPPDDFLPLTDDALLLCATVQNRPNS